MSNYSTQIQELRDEAKRFDTRDHRKTILIEKAVKIADQNNDQQEQFSTRMELVESAVSSGRIELALAAYGFILGMVDQYPEKFKFNWGIAWYYKWIIPCMVQIPTISKEKIMNVLDDMTKRNEKQGYGRRVAVYYRYKIAKQMGEFETARKYYDEQLELKAGFMEMDCTACVMNLYVHFLCQTNREEEAWKHAEGILSGKNSCKHVPQGTYTTLMISSLEKGNLEKAQELAGKLLPMIKLSAGELRNFTNLMLLRLVEKNYTRVLELFNYYFPHVINSFEKDDAFEFYLVSRQLFKLLSNDSKEIKLNMPEEFPIKNSANTYDIKVLEKWFMDESLKIENAFNQRNGNTHFTNLRNKYEAIYEQYK